MNIASEAKIMTKSKNISGLCKRAGMTRQNYYAMHKTRMKQKIDKELIVLLVKNERKHQPRIGVRKLHRLIEKDLAKQNISIGRDRLFDILRDESMLIEKKKTFTPKTTDARHSLPVFKNLLYRYEATGSEQIWVSDITYIRTEEGFVFAALITDAFSRKIVGAHIGDTLESIGACKALDMAIDSLSENSFPIHHSDRGSQYCCHEYVDKLKKRDLSISMTEENHCYENALAERVNGILKDEFYLDMTFRNKKDAYKAFWEAIHIYNDRRPHLSLDYSTPAEVHAGNAA